MVVGNQRLLLFLRSGEWLANVVPGKA